MYVMCNVYMYYNVYVMYIYDKIEREKEEKREKYLCYLQKWSHLVIGAGKSEICNAGQQAGSSDKDLRGDTL